MRRRVVALAFAALAFACSSRATRLERLYDAARQDVWRGVLTQALDSISRGESTAGAADQEWSWKFRLLRAEVLILRRELDAAKTLLDAAPPPTDGSLAARRTYLLAQTQLLQGKLSESIAMLAGARQQAAAASAEDVVLDVDVLHGQALLRDRRWSEAETMLQDVVSRAAARRDAYHQATALHNLGMGRVIRNRFDEAIVFFDRLIALKEIETYVVYATALTNMGLSYARLGEFERATELQRRAVESHEQRGLPMYLEQAMGELGNTHMLQAKPGEALKYLTGAYEVATNANLTADAALWAGNVATASVVLGDLDRAERFNREGMRLKAATKGNTLHNTLNAALIASGRGQIEEARRLYQEALAKGSEPAAEWEAHAGLARTALASGNAREAIAHFDAALRTIQQVRADLLKPEYRLTFLARVIRFYQDYVDMLVTAGDADRALAVADSSRGVVLAEKMGGVAETQVIGTAKFVAAAAGSNTVWLAFWLGPARSYVWVVTGSGVHMAALPPASRIERLVEQHHATIQNASVDALGTQDSPGDALYSALIAPVATFIPRGSSLRIVSDGALHGVNFETLPVDGPRRHYWIEDVTIAMAPSLGILAASAARPLRQAQGGAVRQAEGGPRESGPASLLLVGDPTPRLREFPRLGYAPVEMQAVSKHFDAARTVRHDGDRASPAEYFAVRPERFSVIHFTAHGAANRTSPLDSAVILAGPPGADKLYARDVAERSLHAELVTISACRSAGERAYPGEGLIGFSWAFLRAGARQVIAGLWDVDDQSTAALMDALYAGIASGQRAPDALRAAKLSLIARGGNVARPYYWGPFEVFAVSP